MSRPLFASCSTLRSVLSRHHPSVRTSLAQSRSSRACPIHPIRPNPVFSRSYAIPAPFPTQRKPNQFRPVIILASIMPIVTFFLGVWQVKRLRWKLDLIEEIERNIEREPMLLPPHINLTALPDFAFRRVLLKGHFEGPPLLFGPIIEQGIPGYGLILPFVRSPLPNSTTVPSTILVNRGFITKTRAEGIKAGREPVPGLQDGEVVIEGMMTKRFTEGKGSWTPENEPEKNEWFWKDAKGMAEFVGGEERGVQPVLVDAIDDGSIPSSYLMQQGIPVGRPPTVEVRNQHATYAMTWFSLSAATAVMLVLLFKRGRGKKVLPTRSSRI